MATAPWDASSPWTLHYMQNLCACHTGAELRKLYEEYFQAIKKNVDIDNACEKLQEEVSLVKAQRSGCP